MNKSSPQNLDDILEIDSSSDSNTSESAGGSTQGPIRPSDKKVCELAKVAFKVALSVMVLGVLARFNPFSLLPISYSASVAIEQIFSFLIVILTSLSVLLGVISSIIIACNKHALYGYKFSLAAIFLPFIFLFLLFLFFFEMPC